MEPIKSLSVSVDRSKIINLEKGKLPPQAIDLEEAILGSMMVDSLCVDDVMMILKNEDVFYKDNHKHIFASIKKLYTDSKVIDLLTVSYELKSAGKLEEIGGDLYLIQLTQKVSSSAHAEYHSYIILQEYIKRQLIKDASEMLSKAYDPDVDIFDLLNETSLRLDNLNDQTSTGANDLTQKQSLDMIAEKLQILSKRDVNEISGVHTGFKKIDLVTSGWQPTDLIIVAARPGMGKTSFVLKTMLENVKNDIPVGFVSLEMSTIQLTTRMVACNSHFHLNQLFREGFKHTKYWQQFLDLKSKMDNYPAYYDDKSTDVYDVIAKLRKWKRKNNIKLAIIDYLQLMSCKSLGKNALREQEIATITRMLKRLAKELNIPIILLSQLSRKVEERGSSKRPMLSDLRESGAIEQDADLVSFLYRSSYYNIDVDEDMEAIGANSEFIIAKHRNGSIDRVGLFFDENKTKFMDPEEKEYSDKYDKQKNDEVYGAVNTIPSLSAEEAFGSPNSDKDVPF